MDNVVEQLLGIRSYCAIEHMSRKSVDAVKRVLLDSLGCALGATSRGVPRVLTRVAVGQSANGPCTIIGDGRTTTAEGAAFVNGVLVRYLDFNDTYTSEDGLGHPSDYLGAVLAAAEECDASGEAVLRGIAASYEVYCRLTDALPIGFKSFDHVVYGNIASAYGAAVVWNMSDEALGHAISLAITPNVSLLATRAGALSDWKGCAAGNAARNGMFAARLALHGISGPESPFEGRGGLCSALGRGFDSAAFKDESRGLAVERVHLKPWPCGVLAQSAIQAAQSLAKDLPSSKQLASVTVKTFELAVRMMASDSAKWSPSTPSTADHSLPYVVARTLVDGDLNLGSFNRGVLSDERVQRIMSVMRVEEDPKLSSMWPDAMPASVSLAFSDGSLMEASVERFRGFAADPMPATDLEAKFRTLSEIPLGPAGSTRAIDSCYRLEEVGARELLRTCVSASPLHSMDT